MSLDIGKQVYYVLSFAQLGEMVKWVVAYVELLESDFVDGNLVAEDQIILG